MKHRRIFWDTIQGIKDPALRRLAQKAGATRVSSIVYLELRGILVVMVKDLIESAATVAEYHERSTIQIGDVKFALENEGQAFGGFTTKTCKVRSKKPLETKRIKKARPDTEAVREIKYYQAHSDCLAIPKGPFQRVVREKLQLVSNINRISGDALLLFQTIIEDRLVKILQAAVKVAVSKKHKTLSYMDVRLAYDLQKGGL